jgi:fatty-acyl-CoA synthase
MPLNYPGANVWTLLANIADERPAAPASIYGDRTLTFAELVESALRAAQGMASAAMRAVMSAVPPGA